MSIHLKHTTSSQWRNSALRGALFFFVGLSLLSCSQKNMELFFDIPPPDPAAIAAEEAAKKKAEQEAGKEGEQESPADNLFVAQAAPWSAPPSLDPDAKSPPAIEQTVDWEEAQEILPKDDKGGEDWVAALEQDLVRPRVGADPRSLDASAFKFDFMMKPQNEAMSPGFDAYFPHSAHTEWLGCKNCHPAIFPYKGNATTMGDVRAGKACGVCHGMMKTVAFSQMNCKRCHVNM